MTLGEFEKEHPQIGTELRRFTGDNVGQVRRWQNPSHLEVEGVYSVYEEGVQAWYAIVVSVYGQDMAIYKDGKWAWTDDYFLF